MREELGGKVADNGQVVRLSHVGHLHPLGDAPSPQQVNHDDVDGPVLQHVAEGHDAVVVLAGGYRRVQGVGDARKAFVVLVVRWVLQPEQVVCGQLPSDGYGRVDVPALVDIQHDVDVGAHRLAHDLHAGDLLGCGVLCAHAEFHGLEALGHQVCRALSQLLQVIGTPQLAAEIRGHAVPEATQEAVNRFT